MQINLITDETEKVKLSYASKWSLGIVVALNIFLDPTDVMDKVLPLDTEPDQDGNCPIDVYYITFNIMSQSWRIMKHYCAIMIKGSS